MTEKEFYALLSLFAPCSARWNKPPESLWHAVRNHEDRLVLDASGLHRFAENFTGVVSHMADDGTLWYLYERYRLFSNKVREYRPRFVTLSEDPDDEPLPVAFTETGNNSLDFIEEAFRQETRWPLDRLRLAIERLRLAETHDSFAFAGMRSTTWGVIGHYYAAAGEFRNGRRIITIDEHGVATYLAWETEATMRIRRARDYRPPKHS